MKPSLEIIIVNWNAGPSLDVCLRSIRDAHRCTYELGRVVVVDNASTDGSVDCPDAKNLPFSLERNVENRGFAAACNQGARNSSANYLLFLNPDVRLDADTLQTSIQFMEQMESAQVGICGVQLFDDTGKVSRSCARFPTAGTMFCHMLGFDRLFPGLFKGHFLSLNDHLKSGPVDQVMGAFFLVRRSLFEALRGFDERFFVYFEDLDFAYRARQLGSRSYHFSTSQAYHRGGVCSEQVKAQRLFYSLRSRILYANKHFESVAATGVLIGTLLLEPFSRCFLALAHKSRQEMRETLQAYKILLISLPSIVRNKSGAAAEKKVTGGKVGSIPV